MNDSDHTGRLAPDSGLETVRQSPDFRGPVDPPDDHDHSNDHIALLYENRKEQFAAAIPFIRQGLERGDRCLYIADEHSQEEVLEAMSEEGIDVEAALASNALLIQTKEETYTRNGTFDPDEMIAFLEETIHDATEEYESLRVTGEMTWALSDDSPIDTLIEYEGELNNLLLNKDCIVLCQYNRERFSSKTIYQIIRTHPYLLYSSTVFHNVYYKPPAEFFGPTQHNREVGRMLETLREQTETKIELREREQKLEELVDRLEMSNERLEKFAYAASHDLQEPLRMVSSYLQLIEKRYANTLDEDGREFLGFATDGADRMREMIDSLLKYSRIKTRGDPFEPVDLDAVLQDVIDDLQFRIEESEAEITMDPLPTVEGDRDQLRQVVQNLLDNAIDYSGDAPPRVHVSAERSGREWIVSVSDEGIGIDQDDADQIFSVFQRLHSREEHPGTGIGLALCQRIVERHGGEIWVESEPGQGATFSFTLSAASGRDM